MNLTTATAELRDWSSFRSVVCRLKWLQAGFLPSLVESGIHLSMVQKWAGAKSLTWRLGLPLLQQSRGIRTLKVFSVFAHQGHTFCWHRCSSVSVQKCVFFLYIKLVMVFLVLLGNTNCVMVFVWFKVGGSVSTNPDMFLTLRLASGRYCSINISRGRHAENWCFWSHHSAVLPKARLMEPSRKQYN